MTDLRVLSWNLWELRGDLRAVLDVLEDLAPDVLLLQEAPRFVAPRSRLAWLARRIDRRILVGGAGTPQGRGLAILGSEEIAAQVIRRGLHPVARRIVDANSLYPRGVAAVRLSVPGGGELVAASTHFALHPGDRLAHAEHLRSLVRGAGAPVVVGGDFNEVPGGPCLAALDPVLHDPADPAEHTFPAARPRRRIDAVLTTPDLRVRAARRVSSTDGVSTERLAGASDHLPTVVDLSV